MTKPAAPAPLRKGHATPAEMRAHYEEIAKSCEAQGDRALAEQIRAVIRHLPQE